MPVKRILSFVRYLRVARVKSLLCLNSTLVLVWKRLTTSNSIWERLHSVWTTRGERPESVLGKKTVHKRRSSSEHELLLTLVKLRHNIPKSDLAVRFALSQSTVSRTFSTLVLCLYHFLKENCTSTLYVGMHNTVVYMITRGSLFSFILHNRVVSILDDGLYGLASSPGTRSSLAVQRYFCVQNRKTERTVETDHAHEWYTLHLLVQLLTTSIYVHVLEIQLFKLSFSP